MRRYQDVQRHVGNGAKGVYAEPPYALPGHRTSPIPGNQETAWAVRPQPPIAGVNIDSEDQVALIRELAGLWDDVPDRAEDRLAV